MTTGRNAPAPTSIRGRGPAASFFLAITAIQQQHDGKAGLVPPRSIAYSFSPRTTTPSARAAAGSAGRQRDTGFEPGSTA
jgi:hypothetical protein